MKSPARLSAGLRAGRGRRSSVLVIPDGTTVRGRDDVRLAPEASDDVAPESEHDAADPEGEERRPEGVVCCELHNVVPHRGPLSWER